MPYAVAISVQPLHEINNYAYFYGLNREQNMAEIIKMPRLSDTMEEGVIVAWHKKVGDKVAPGDVLAEVETDKATMDLESFQQGTLLYIGVKEGPVPVDGIIAVIGKEGEDYKKALAKAEAEAPAANDAGSADVVNEANDRKDTAPQPENDNTGQSATSGTDNQNDRLKASPLAKKIARDAGIDIAAVTGTGEGGRIVKKDVEQAIEKGSGAAHLPAFTPGMQGGYEEVPVSQMRKTIARRLGESKFTAPHFYLTIEVNMGKVWDARKELNAMSDSKISFNDIVIKAVALSLKKHPAVNSSWMGDKIRLNKDVNIGVAVAVEDGLLVPVVRHADQKPMSYINSEVAILAEKARNKKLTPEEMQGNTFTISNLGMFGIEEFTAIINPPDACILAVGGIIEKPIALNGQIQLGKMMKLTLSCDHRVVDGATGAKFLQTLKAGLENPLSLLA